MNSSLHVLQVFIWCSELTAPLSNVSENYSPQSLFLNDYWMSNFQNNKVTNIRYFVICHFTFNFFKIRTHLKKDDVVDI